MAQMRWSVYESGKFAVGERDGGGFEIALRDKREMEVGRKRDTMVSQSLSLRYTLKP